MNGIHRVLINSLLCHPVFGCADPDTPLGHVVEREAGRVTWRCNATGVTHQLRCNDVTRAWEGPADVCSQGEILFSAIESISVVLLRSVCNYVRREIYAE